MRLVSFTATDGLRLDGILAEPENPEIVVVHVHGKCGNFYQNDFIKTMATVYPEHRLSFLAFNNRGHDCIGEAYGQRLTMGYTGGSIEIFEECESDIAGAISYCKALGARKVILQGHSNGCEKILYYLTRRVDDMVRGIILLSPSDSRELHRRYISPETIEDQLKRLQMKEQEKERVFLADAEYGINVPGKVYHIPIVTHSLRNLLSGVAFQIIRYDVGVPKALKPVPACIYVGGKDPFMTAAIDRIQEVFITSYPDSTFIIRPDGGHHFNGLETTVVSQLGKWVISILEG